MNNQPHHETIQEQLNAQQEALVQIYKSVEKTRKIIFWSGVINILVFILPLIFVVIMLPKIMNTFTSSLNALEGVSEVGSVSDILSNPDLQEALQGLEGLGF